VRQVGRDQIVVDWRYSHFVRDHHIQYTMFSTRCCFQIRFEGGSKHL